MIEGLLVDLVPYGTVFDRLVTSSPTHKTRAADISPTTSRLSRKMIQALKMGAV